MKGLTHKEWYILNAIYPIAYFRQAKNGKALLVKRSSILQQKRSIYQEQATRGKITKLSRKSLSKLAFVAQVTAHRFQSILTLTFCKVVKSGRLVKTALKMVLGYLQTIHPGIEWLWWLEFQKRGSPHFHILLSENVSRETHILLAVKWAELQQLNDKEWLKAYNVTAHRNSWEALRSKDGAAGYVTQYAKKKHQKEVPEGYTNVGRFWGIKPGLVEKCLDKAVISDQSEVKAMLHDLRPELENWEFYPKYISLFDKSQSAV